MIEFKDLKYIIQKACKSDKSDNINDGFSFSINAEKLESILNTKSDLHVLAFSENIRSRYANLEDLQLLTEYITNYSNQKSELASLYDGKAQFLEFMLYCDKSGDLNVANEDGIIDKKTLFKCLNGGQDTLDKDIIISIIENFPIYRTLVIKRFNHKKEKFEYQIYFRSNYAMITYVKDLKEAGLFLDEQNSENNTSK